MALRAISSGTISFGLVAVPVKLYSATQPKSVSFRLLHAKDNSRLRQQYVCQKCNEVVERGDMVKGYEYAKDQYAILTEDEIRAVEQQTDQSIEIEEFVPLSSVDPVYFEKAYLLGPDRAGQKAYRLLCEAMKKAKMAAVGKFSTRGKQQLVVVRQANGGLMLHQIDYADEVNSFAEIDTGEGFEAKAGELDLAVQLVQQLASKQFEPQKYEDEYRKKLLDVIEQKIAGHEIAMAPPRAPKAQIIDLMDALKASLAARQEKGETARAEPKRKPARAKGRTAARANAERAKG